jgi:hypothetical protein
MSVPLFDPNGQIVAHVKRVPRGALAFKFNDPTERAYWVHNQGKLSRLRSEDAPLGYTLAEALRRGYVERVEK